MPGCSGWGATEPGDEGGGPLWPVNHKPSGPGHSEEAREGGGRPVEGKWLRAQGRGTEIRAGDTCLDLRRSCASGPGPSLPIFPRKPPTLARPALRTPLCVLSETRSENIPEATQKVKQHKSEQQNKANLSAKETQSDYARCPRGHSRSRLVTEKKRRFHGPHPACPPRPHGTCRPLTRPGVGLGGLLLHPAPEETGGGRGHQETPRARTGFKVKALQIEKSGCLSWKLARGRVTSRSTQARRTAKRASSTSPS